MTDLIVDHKPRRRKWTDEALHQEALKYISPKQFRAESKTAYNLCLRRGIIDQVCDHMDRERLFRSDDEVREIALGYDTRVAFQKAQPSVYNVADRRGMLDEICAHMKKSSADNDCVYLWKPKTLAFYKVGVTSTRLGNLRMNQVARAMGWEPELIIQTSVKKRATEIELEIKQLGIPVSFSTRFNGSSEFRWLSDNEVAQAVGIIASNSWLN